MSEAKVAKRSEKHAVIYFEPGAGQAMKDLAAQIRGEGGQTTLAWANRWKGAESVLPEAKAVIVQKGCANEEDIVEAYKKFSHDVEIHFVNEDGYGVEAEERATDEPEPREENPEAVSAETADSRSAAEPADDTDAGESEDDEPEDVSGDPDGDEEDADSGGAEEDRLEG